MLNKQKQQTVKCSDWQHSIEPYNNNYYLPAVRDSKSTPILYLSGSKSTCVKNDFGKHESTDPHIYPSKSKKYRP